MPIVQPLYWAPLTALTAALVINRWLAGSRFAALALDHPNRRSLHQSPVPRTGGIGLHAGVLLAWAVISPGLPYSLWVALAALIAISLLNDLREIAAIWRLAVHILAGALFAADVLHAYDLPVKVLAAIAVAWMANLYNFMDGSDGLAGGMALIGFSFYGLAAAATGSTEFALVNFSIAAAAAAFLFFNFHPARIFMGDVGSVPLGFLAAALGTIGWVRGDWAWWFPVLVFFPFIADATVTLARRLLAGEKPWRAHRDHYYQRLVQMGWGHRRTAIAEYVLMGASGCLAFAASAAPRPLQLTLIATAIVAYVGLLAAVELAWRRFKG